MEKMTKVLVTGCCGFLGSHLVKRLISDTDWTIIGIDNLSYCATLKNIQGLPEDRFRFVKLDFCDYEFLHYLFSVNQFKIVFHIGAFTHVDNSFNNSLVFTRNNTLGTHTLLEIARKFKTEKFIHMSTDEVYGTIPEGETADESFRFNPSNPYSVSKSNAEEIIRTYKENYKMNIIVVRGNNIIGTHQFVEKVIPKFILRLLRKEKLCIHGTGLATRNFTAVEDMTRAILLISQKSGPQEIWNVGNVEKYTILETAEMILKTIRNLAKNKPELFTDEQIKWLFPSVSEGSKIETVQKESEKSLEKTEKSSGELEKTEKEELIEFVEDRLFNDMRYDLNISKVEKLGFVPEIEFSDELEKIVEWYVRNQDYYNDMNIAKYTKPHCR